MTEPGAVLSAYGITNPSLIHKITGGKINKTWLVEDQGRRYILQRIHPGFRAGMIDDTALVLSELRADGWDVPEVLPTTSGQLQYVSDGLWRLCTFIESDDRLPPMSPELLSKCGELLARLHISLGKIKHTIPDPLPHYRDTPFHINHLREVLSSLTGDAHNIAQQTIEAFESQTTPPQTGSTQLIHGDPKINNILFRNQQPYTYIDWDGARTSYPLLDLGDFVRSFTKEYLQDDVKTLISSFCQGYYDTERLDFSISDELFMATVGAAKTIALENTARYLYDIVDQSFWEWDKSKYVNQEEAMLDQAHKTWQIFERLDS